MLKPIHRPQAPAPRVLPGFGQINRYWDRTHECYVAKILPGEYYVTEADELIGRLSSMVDRLVAKEEQLAQALEAERQRAEAEQQRADRAEQRAAQLEARLRELGHDPDG